MQLRFLSSITTEFVLRQTGSGFGIESNDSAQGTSDETKGISSFLELITIKFSIVSDISDPEETQRNQY
jgi:hypothetical protein